jgi:hypothetical protein
MFRPTDRFLLIVLQVLPEASSATFPWLPGLGTQNLQSMSQFADGRHLPHLL